MLTDGRGTEGRSEGEAAERAATPRHIALVDGGSFVPAYVHHLALALRERGHRLSLFVSGTRFNQAFIDALRGDEGIELVVADVSGSVVPRWRGVLNYAAQLLQLWRRRREFDTINLQFSVLWPLELPVWWLLRRRLAFTVHNAVPHGHPGRRHRPTAWIAACARHLVFVSQATHDDFMHRYGSAHAVRAVVAPHGLVPLAPGDPVRPPRPLPDAPEALVYWSTVKPYKGVDLMAQLAHSEAWRARGLPLEVHGRWDHELRPLRDELRASGVVLDERYLDANALRRLMSRPVVFVLPYREASQSGALYTLLAEGCWVVCSDTGDLGAALRRFGLEALLLRERSVDAVIEVMDRLQARGPALQDALRAAQQRLRWRECLRDAWVVYDAAPPS